MTTAAPSKTSRVHRFGVLVGAVCDRMAQAALVLIVLNIVASTLLGVVAVVAWPRYPVLGSGPGGAYGIPGMVLLAATAMGIPSMLLTFIHVIRGEWRKLGRALPFVGPAFLFFAFFFVSHAFDPCGFDFTSMRTELLGSPLCQPWGGGLEIHARYHLLHHAVVPTIFLVGVYAIALRKWHPAAHLFGGWRRTRAGS